VKKKEERNSGFYFALFSAVILVFIVVAGVITGGILNTLCLILVWSLVISFPSFYSGGFK
jgi:hypothetical protein